MIYHREYEKLRRKLRRNNVKKDKRKSIRRERKISREFDRSRVYNYDGDYDEDDVNEQECLGPKALF